MEDRITLDLTKAEALVLFDWLARSDDETRCDDPAAQQVLWLLEGQLEKKLVEPLDPNYAQLLTQARERVRGT